MIRQDIKGCESQTYSHPFWSIAFSRPAFVWFRRHSQGDMGWILGKIVRNEVFQQLS